MGEDQKYHVIGIQELEMPDFPCPDGWILDFGGGGEGIIGQIKGSRVVAIDRLERELIEARENGSRALPIIMDGTELKYPENTFLTATAFFALMYVQSEQLEAVFREIYRVLIPGAQFFVWDAVLREAERNDNLPLVIRLNLTLPSGKKVETGYGTKKTSQNIEVFLNLAQKIGFEVSTQHSHKLYFELILKKPQ